MNKALIVIPARMASTRLPGKPLISIAGRPMIVWVWQRAIAAALGPVVVAAAEAEIADVITAAGGRAVLTRPDHPSGSDRVFEAVEQVDPGGHYGRIINLQGDLPTLPPEDIRKVAGVLTNRDVDIATLIAKITDPEERSDPSVVKAVVSMPPDADQGRALYFTRSTAPSGEGPLFHHIGIYAYTRPALKKFVTLPPGHLEKRERLEQLRALEAGMRIDAHLVQSVPLGVDTPAQLEQAGARLAGA